MKVLQLISANQKRGAEIFGLQLSKHLREAGVDTRVVALYGGRADPRSSLDLGEDVVLLNGNAQSFLEIVPSVQPRLVKALIDLFQHWGPDVVQLNGGRTAKYGVFARRWSRHKPVLVYRKIGNSRLMHRQPWKWYYQRWVFPNIDGVVAVSRFDAEELQTLGLIRKRIPLRVIPNAVDPSVWENSTPDQEEVSLPEEVPVLLFVGSLSEEKRPLDVLRIYRMLRERGRVLQLWMVGDGPLRGRLEEAARDISGRGAIRFWGWQENLGWFYRRASVLVLASAVEGIPAVILEAGFFGVPAVAPSVGGIPECIRHGETGFLYAPGDLKEAVRWVENLIMDARRREHMGEQARQWVRSRFLMRQIAKEYLKFYDELLQTRRPHSD